MDLRVIALAAVLPIVLGLTGAFIGSYVLKRLDARKHATNAKWSERLREHVEWIAKARGNPALLITLSALASRYMGFGITLVVLSVMVYATGIYVEVVSSRLLLTLLLYVAGGWVFGAGATLLILSRRYYERILVMYLAESPEGPSIEDRLAKDFGGWLRR